MHFAWVHLHSARLIAQSFLHPQQTLDDQPGRCMEQLCLARRDGWEKAQHSSVKYRSMLSFCTGILPTGLCCTLFTASHNTHPHVHSLHMATLAVTMLKAHTVTHTMVCCHIAGYGGAGAFEAADFAAPAPLPDPNAAFGGGFGGACVLAVFACCCCDLAACMARQWYRWALKRRESGILSCPHGQVSCGCRCFM